MKVTVRKALKTDMSSVLKLIKELALFEREPDAVEVSEKELIEAGFGPSPQFNCLVAEVENTVVGMALFYPRFSTWKGRSIHLEDLIVTEAMRGKGIGRALYDKILEFGHAEGVRRVQWEVLNWNEPAVKFYENSGATILKDWWLVHMQEDALKNYIENKE